jgi:cytochrome bd-type quinol oxidase subunit 2
LQGIRVEDRLCWWDWLTSFTVLCGAAVVVGYSLHATGNLSADLAHGGFGAHCHATSPHAVAVYAGLVRAGHAGLGISLWPLIVPPGITIWECCRTAIQPSLPLDWCCRVASDHPWLQAARLLGVSGQGAAEDALPLT